MKQSAQISVEHNYANVGNVTSSRSLNLPDLNNIVADGELDDVNADTDDSNDSGSKQSSIPWGSGRRVVELGVFANALASCKNCTNPLQLSHGTSIKHTVITLYKQIRIRKVNIFEYIDDYDVFHFTGPMQQYKLQVRKQRSHRNLVQELHACLCSNLTPTLNKIAEI